MAIDAGYRYFDTASFYETETYVAEAIESSGIPREEFFIASKLWKTEMGYENAKEAFERTLENLKNRLSGSVSHPLAAAGSWIRGLERTGQRDVAGAGGAV